MSMSVSAATASRWSSYAAHSRLYTARQDLGVESSNPACTAAVTATRAAVVEAEHEVARIEAVRAADLVRLKASNHTFDLLV